MKGSPGELTVDDTPQTRERLIEEWEGLIQRAAAAGIPPSAVVETMLKVALDQYESLYGSDLLGNYLRDLLMRMDQPLTERDVAEQLITGGDEDELL